MPFHVSLDFTAPFTVGDTVCSTYPPGNQEYTGGPASHECLEGRISSVKLVLELNQGNSCVIKEPLTAKQLVVEAVVYTIIPLPSYHRSPFTVECQTQPGSHPMLFASEAELQAYQNSTGS